MYIIPVTLTKDQYIDLCNLRAKAQRKAEKASLKAKAPSSRAHAAALQCEFMSIAAVVTQISRAMENVQNGATDATHVPTGKRCRVIRRDGERCFCDFGNAVSPFTWVQTSELKEDHAMFADIMGGE